MICISYDSPTEKYTNNSHFELPTFQCKKLSLIILGDLKFNIIKKIPKRYKEKYCGKGTYGMYIK